MRGYRLTAAARRDLSHIWDYTEEHWGIAQAEKYLTEIRGAIERIAEDPDRGRACDQIRSGYWRYSIGSHLIFYTVGAVSVNVIRVLHGRMDPTRHL